MKPGKWSGTKMTSLKAAMRRETDYDAAVADFLTGPQPSGKVSLGTARCSRITCFLQLHRASADTATIVVTDQVWQ